MSHSRRLLQDALPQNSSWGHFQRGRQTFIAFKEPNLGAISKVKQVLEEYGGQIGDYVPDNSIVAVASSAALARIKAFPNVIAVNPRASWGNEHSNISVADSILRSAMMKWISVLL